MKKLLLLFAVLLSTVSGAWAQVLGTSIDVDKVYTLNCKGDHIAFLAYSGGAFTGNSSTPGYLVFEKGPQDNQYYIKSYPDQKYLSYVNPSFSATDDPTTLWQIGTYTHTANVISLACVGETDMYIMNNSYLRLVNASGGPSSSQRCFLWELREASPEIESGQVYRIINKANADKAIGEGTDFLLNANTKDESALSQMWYVEGNNKDGYSLRNLSTADYFDYVNADYAHWKTSATPKKYYIAKGEAAPDYYYITFNATAAPETHASAHYSNGRVVRWRWSDKQTDGSYKNVGASLWQFEKVVDVDAEEKMNSAYSSWYNELSDLSDQASGLVSTGGYAESEVTLTTDNTTCPAEYNINKPTDASSDGGGVAALLDDDNSTFMHTAYKGAYNEPHYIQVDLGEDNTSKFITFSYRARHNKQDNNPETIIVRGSNDGTNFEDIETLTNLPDGLIDYTSNPVGNGTAYRYFRFVVTETSNNAAHEGYVFFALAKFRMSTVSVADTYASKVTVLKKMKDFVQSISFDENRPEDWTTIATKDLVPQLQDLIYGAAIREYPFELTTDKSSPVCYQILSGRAIEHGNTDHYFTLKPDNDGKVKLETTTGDNICSYWFFMEDPENGQLMVIPFVDEKNPLGYVTVSDGADKLTNVHSTTNFAGYHYELIEYAGVAGYQYALKPYGATTNVSNYSGRDYYMGFYNGSADNGTAIKFEEVTTPSLKYRELYSAIELAKSKCPGEDRTGTMLNGYTTESVNEYKNAITEAESLYSAVSTTTEENLQSQINSLNGLSSLLVINLPETGKFYYIKSANTNQYLSKDKSTTLTTTEQKSVNNIFYFERDGENTYLVAYENGHYVTNPWNIGVGEATIKNTEIYKQPKSFVEGQLGKYALKYLADNGSAYYFTASGTSTDATQDKSQNNAQWNLEPVTELPLTIHSSGNSTYSAPVDLVIPGNVTVYYAKRNDGETIRMSPLTDVIPANTGVVVQGEGTVSFPITTGATALENNNLLKPVVAAQAVRPATGNSVFILGTRDDETGFYPLSTTNNIISGHKSYLEIPTPPTARLSIVWDDTETGIHEAEGGEQDVEIYDLAGRRLDKPAKGVNIIGGKLVIK